MDDPSEQPLRMFVTSDISKNEKVFLALFVDMIHQILDYRILRKTLLSTRIHMRLITIFETQ